MKAMSTPTSVSGYGTSYEGSASAADAGRTPFQRARAAAHATPLSSATAAAAAGGDSFHTSPMSPFQPYSAAPRGDFRGGAGAGRQVCVPQRERERERESMLT
jgi:hypothetical protein